MFEITEDQLETPPEEEASAEEEVAEEQEEETASTEEEETAEAKEEGAEETEEGAREEPETVPYGRFKEIYGSLKQTERELEALKQGKVEEEPGKVAEQIPTVGPKPKASDFENYDDYVEALTDFKADQIEAKRQEDEQKTKQEESQRNWDDQVAEAVAKDPQFIEKGYIPSGLAPLLDGTDKLIDFAYYFGENPAEARRLMTLSPTQAAREVGKLEAKFETGPPQRTSTNAPTPTKPVGGKETIQKKPEDMSTEEYLHSKDKEDGLI